MSTPKISKAIIRRLPKYRRYLGQLKRQGIEKISSNELGDIIGCTASQIRQDFNTFGEFGQQGYGYSVNYLYDEINKILGLDTEYRTIIIGVGNLGQAVTNYTYYYKIGFNIIGLFDVNPKIIGNKINDVAVSDYADLESYLEKEHIDIGIITVNRENAQAVADTLVKGGVRGIWNFAPIDLDVPKNVALKSVHLSDSLHELTYMIHSLEEDVEY